MQTFTTAVKGNHRWFAVTVLPIVRCCQGTQITITSLPIIHLWVSRSLQFHRQRPGQNCGSRGQQGSCSWMDDSWWYGTEDQGHWKAVFCSTKHRIQISPWGPRGKGVWHFRLTCHSVNRELHEPRRLGSTKVGSLCFYSTPQPSRILSGCWCFEQNCPASVAFILFSYWMMLGNSKSKYDKIQSILPINSFFIVKFC